MKLRSLARLAGLVVLGWPGLLAPSARAQGAAPATVLTNAGQVAALGNNPARHSNVLVRVRGHVTYALHNRPWVYLQDGTNGLLAIYRGEVRTFTPGALLEVEGTVAPGQIAPLLHAARLTVLGPGALPEPLPADPARLMAGDHFARLVSVRGRVRDLMISWGNFSLRLHDGTNSFTAQMRAPKDFHLPRHWLDAEVEVRGLCWTAVNSRGQPYGFALYAAHTNQVTFLSPGSSNIYERPFHALPELSPTPGTNGARIRTTGVVTYFSEARHMYIEDADTPLHVQFQAPLYQSDADGEAVDHPRPQRLSPGERVEVVGLPQRNGDVLTLTDAEYRPVGSGVAPVARAVPVGELMAGRHAGRVVRIRGRVVNRETVQNNALMSERLILQAGDQVFAAWLENPDARDNPVKKHSYVEVTGVNIPQPGLWQEVHSFTVHLRGPSDIRAVLPPAFWERPETMRTLALAGLVALLAGVWILFQRRQLLRLRASEERFRALIDNSFDVTVVLNADGTVQYMSPSGRRLFGGKEAPEKMSLASVVHADDLPRLTQAHREVLAEPGASRRVSDYRILAADGSVRHAEAIGTNCLHVPGVAGVVVNIRDITARKQAEAEVAARERAEDTLRHALAAERELGQLKSSFVSMVSHEFRTPLEVILSSSNILDRYLDRLPLDKRKTQLRAIRKSVHRMNDLVEDVLLLGKFDAGRMACAPVRLELGGLCRRLVAEVETAAERDGAVRLRLDEIEDEACADEGLCNHIFINLLGNALKYSPPGAVVEFTVTRHGPDAEFTVRDSGCGIPAADQARLFTAFVRGSNVGQTPGSGLGLVIVKRCVDLHEGHIRCQSEEGQGTVFTVTLPLFDGTRRFRRQPFAELQPSHE